MRHALHCGRTSGRPCAFTLVELLVVILILAILLAIATPMYTTSVSAAFGTTCRANMQAIAAAEQAYNASKHAYAAVAAGDDMVAAGLTDLGRTPTCPDGGEYRVVFTGTTVDGRSVPPNSFAVQCTLSGPAHGSFIPGVDGK